MKNFVSRKGITWFFISSNEAWDTVLNAGNLFKLSILLYSSIHLYKLGLLLKLIKKVSCVSFGIRSSSWYVQKFKLSPKNKIPAIKRTFIGIPTFSTFVHSSLPGAPWK